MDQSNSKSIDFSRLFGKVDSSVAPQIPDPAELREHDVAKAYVRNMHRVQAIKNDILDGLVNGKHAEELLLMACDAIGIMANDATFYRRIKDAMEQSTQGQQIMHLSTRDRISDPQEMPPDEKSHQVEDSESLQPPPEMFIHI